MDRKKLLKQLRKLGWYYKRHGGNHDIYTDGKRTMPVPRHNEVDEFTAKEILKKARGNK